MTTVGDPEYADEPHSQSAPTGPEARGCARSSDGARSGLIGERPTLIGVIVGFAAAALTAASSPLREATNRATDGSASPSSEAMRRSPYGPTPGR
jgi:hypothetical protein